VVVEGVCQAVEPDAKRGAGRMGKRCEASEVAQCNISKIY